MKIKPIRFFLSLSVLSLLLISCFSVSQKGGIVEYKQGKVYTGWNRFHVGKLSANWRGPEIHLKQLVYKNDSLQGTIVTDALCGDKFQDDPLKRLAKDFFLEMKSVQYGEDKSLMIDGREAYRLRGVGRLDGVILEMEVVVLKKDFCLYDFMYFSPTNTFHEGLDDFRGYVSGFSTN